MLEYQKTILRKVSFSKDLFRSELKKSFILVEEQEIRMLMQWVLAIYGNEHKDVIMDVLANIDKKQNQAMRELFLKLN